jgi:hypothetical protein
VANIRQCVDSLILPLCYLVNQSFITGQGKGGDEPDELQINTKVLTIKYYIFLCYFNPSYKYNRTRESLDNIRLQKQNKLSTIIVFLK